MKKFSEVFGYITHIGIKADEITLKEMDKFVERQKKEAIIEFINRICKFNCFNDGDCSECRIADLRDYETNRNS